MFCNPHPVSVSVTAQVSISHYRKSAIYYVTLLNEIFCGLFEAVWVLNILLTSHIQCMVVFQCYILFSKFSDQLVINRFSVIEHIPP